MVQSCPEASPAKWHLAHTAWFFESFILREFLPGYRLFNTDFPWLFNSYYQSFADFPEKRLRASFSRPGLDEVLAYRSMWTKRSTGFSKGTLTPRHCERIELGANHEEQHQELLLTDILHAFFTNPLRPAYISPELAIGTAASSGTMLEPLGLSSLTAAWWRWVCRGRDSASTMRLPRHRVWLEPSGWPIGL